MSALLQAVKCVPSPTPDALDPYWTLMAYFNSLRELGHAATLIRADIREYLNAEWDRLNIRKPKAPNTPDLRRFINRDLELTSRIPSSEITNVLQQLFNPYPGTDDRRPVDVCLATNMIKWADVPRLGLMTVVGSPDDLRIYSGNEPRRARCKGPGLVVTVFNAGKPRDRSHFEHFRSYHQTIYRWLSLQRHAVRRAGARARFMRNLSRLLGRGNPLSEIAPIRRQTTLCSSAYVTS
jgi:hypothetical protein